MQDLQPFMTAAVVVVCAALLVIKILYDRALDAKGSLSIKLEHPAAKLGESITGVVELVPGQDIEASALDIHLTCYLKVRTGSDDSGRTESHLKKIYRTTVRIRDACQFSQGRSESMAFVITMPSPALDAADEKKVRKHYTEDHQHNLQWKLEAHLDCKGVDLNDTLRFAVPWISSKTRQAAWNQQAPFARKWS